MNNTLFLRLEGAMQSWGERGRWSIRDTAPEPTKSGVIGLIGCAMGVSDDATLRMMSKQTMMGVRIDQAGTRLTDYHTIGGGYEVPALLTAEGKPKKSGGRSHTEISLRDYLCDASFLVALRSEDEALIERMANALTHPIWIPFLGRKSCPPSRPIFAATLDTPSLESALAAPLWSDTVIDTAEDNLPRKPITKRLPTTLECQPNEDGATHRRDHLYSRQYRTFHPRYTRIGDPLYATVDTKGTLTIQYTKEAHP